MNPTIGVCLLLFAAATAADQGNLPEVTQDYPKCSEADHEKYNRCNAEAEFDNVFIELENGTDTDPQYNFSTDACEVIKNFTACVGEEYSCGDLESVKYDVTLKLACESGKELSKEFDRISNQLADAEQYLDDKLRNDTNLQCTEKTVVDLSKFISENVSHALAKVECPSTARLLGLLKKDCRRSYIPDCSRLHGTKYYVRPTRYIHPRPPRPEIIAADEDIVPQVPQDYPRCSKADREKYRQCESESNIWKSFIRIDSDYEWDPRFNFTDTGCEAVKKFMLCAGEEYSCNFPLGNPKNYVLLNLACESGKDVSKEYDRIQSNLWKAVHNFSRKWKKENRGKCTEENVVKLSNFLSEIVSPALAKVHCPYAARHLWRGHCKRSFIRDCSLLHNTKYDQLKRSPRRLPPKADGKNVPKEAQQKESVPKKTLAK